MASDSCTDVYNDATSRFEGVLFFPVLLFLFLTVAFIPKNEDLEQQQRQRCCGFLVPCLRASTSCLAPCRPLLDKDEARATAAAQDVGACCSMGYIIVFLLVQTLPILGLIIGVAFFYPECPCSEPESCQCTFRVDFVPVGSCTGAAIFFVSMFSLLSLAFMSRTVQALRLVRNAALYSTDSTISWIGQDIV